MPHACIAFCPGERFPWHIDHWRWFWTTSLTDMIRHNTGLSKLDGTQQTLNRLGGSLVLFLQRTHVSIPRTCQALHAEVCLEALQCDSNRVAQTKSFFSFTGHSLWCPASCAKELTIFAKRSVPFQVPGLSLRWIYKGFRLREHKLWWSILRTFLVHIGQVWNSWEHCAMMQWYYLPRCWKIQWRADQRTKLYSSAFWLVACGKKVKQVEWSKDSVESNSFMHFSNHAS